MSARPSANVTVPTRIEARLDVADDCSKIVNY